MTHQDQMPSSPLLLFVCALEYMHTHSCLCGRRSGDGCALWEQKDKRGEIS